MKTVQIQIETKKGERKITTWGVWQDRPYPTISGHSGRMEWTNTDDLLETYGRPAKGLGTKYSAVLLRDGWTPETATGNRHDYAGFIPYQTTEPIPGTIVYRGKYLGEITAEIDNRETFQNVSFRVRGTYNRATGSEAAFLADQVAPGLLACVKENLDELKAEAIAGIRQKVGEALAEVRESLNKIEAEMDKVISKL